MFTTEFSGWKNVFVFVSYQWEWYNMLLFKGFLYLLNAEFRIRLGYLMVRVFVNSTFLTAVPVSTRMHQFWLEMNTLKVTGTVTFVY